MESTQQLFDSALNLHQAGKLQEAEELYRRILAASPDDADVLELLGMVNFQLGRREAALDLLQKSAALNPDAPDCHYHLGMVLNDLGRTDAAIEAFRQATVLKPDFAEAYHHLGLIYREKNQLDLSERHFHLALALNPEYVEAHNNLATVLKSRGKLDEAVAAYRQALALRPDLADVHSNLGNALSAQGKLEEAIDAYRQSLSIKADNPEISNKLGLALIALNRPREAAVAYRRALADLPDNPSLRNNLGNALLMQSELTEAVSNFRKAVDADPKFFLAFNNLGNALKDLGQIPQSIAAYEHALSLRNDPYFYCNILYTLHLLSPYNADAIFHRHQEWNRRYSQTLVGEILPPTNDRDPNRRLKIGYVSSDFRLHSVAFFLENLLDYHDPQQVEVFAYADVGQPDAVTRRLQQSIHQWRSIYGKSDVEVARMIRQDQIDILVDLAGHTAGNRLLVFARKPAPVQITYLGYPDTTGLTAIDYRMTDIYADPLGQTEKYHSEKLLRLPRTFACYRPPAEATEVSPLPAVTYGRVTFACFTTLGKLPPNLLDCWAEILIQVPTSRLLIAAGGLQSNDLQREIRSHFERRGIDPTRLDLMGKRPLSEYFSLHHQVDIYLDTFPVNGHTVTCHALWMGLPVVTLAGSVHCQRLGASVLSNLGRGELIAKSPQEYVQIAASLAGDVPKLKAMRSNLREKMKSSPILDAAQFARDVEGAYREIWKNWCASPQPTEEELAYRRALSQNPNSPEAHTNLGVVFHGQGRWADAIAEHEQAIAIRPEFPEAHFNLGAALKAAGSLDEAIAAYRRCLTLQPQHTAAMNNLANALRDIGQLDEALSFYKKASDAAPEYDAPATNRLYTLYFHSNYDAAAILKEHQEWSRRRAAPFASKIQPHTSDLSPDRRIRLGYVSPDFRDHPVGLALEPLLENHDHNNFEIVCFANSDVDDDVTRRLRSHADRWHRVFQLSDDQVADLIRHEQIDMLFDLSLHMAHNRLLTFAQKPAPVQVTYLGYPGTTGLPTIDCRISDPYLDPPGSDTAYSERTVRLPHTYICWRWSGGNEPLSSLPAAKNGFITFGSLNTFCKVTPHALETWGKLMNEVKDSRLLLRCPPGQAAKWVLQTLSKFGISESRIELSGRLPWDQYVALCKRQDIGLDPFPYPGHTTSLDSLWLGVPFVTLRGDNAVARGGASILSNLGLFDLIANTPDEYIQIARNLAADLPRLAELRSGLRNRVEQSPLTNARQFARDFESACREIWQAACRRPE